MTDLDRSILATLSYYGVLDYPLTLIEIYKYLINPTRIDSNLPAMPSITLKTISTRLDYLVTKNIICQKNGFYFLPNKNDLSELRIERQKISAVKWKKLLRKAKWFQVVPYLRGLFVSGSMALGNTEENSDYDILVIMKSGRLYLGRIFLSLVSSLMFSRRKRYDTKAPDKFCFNHYITDDSLHMKHESLFNAETYSYLKPILISPELHSSFWGANIWINKYVYNFKPSLDSTQHKIKPSKTINLIAKTGEKIFNSRFGDMLEKMAKKYQQKRIEQNPATHMAGGRVIYSDTELEFHPHSFEKKLLEEYNSRIKYLKISDNEEPDSGLIR